MNFLLCRSPSHASSGPQGRTRGTRVLPPGGRLGGGGRGGPPYQHPPPHALSMALHDTGHIDLLPVTGTSLAWSTIPAFPHDVPSVWKVLCPLPMVIFQLDYQKPQSEEAQGRLKDLPRLDRASLVHQPSQLPLLSHSLYPSSQVKAPGRFCHHFFPPPWDCV